MVKVAAAILTNDKKRAKILANKFKQADFIQIDVMDGKFVPGKTIWAKDIASLKIKKLELHLMINNPEKHLSDFIKCKPLRIIVHYESTKKLSSIIKKLKKARIKIGVAINPRTRISNIKKYLRKIDFVLIMTVTPGKQGQKFMTSMLSKIKQLRKISKIDIGVDGGVNNITAKLAIKAGASTIASGSYFTKSGNPNSIIKYFKKL